MSERELNRIEVLSQVTQDRMTAVTAANVLGLSRRQIHRLLKAFQAVGHGADIDVSGPAFDFIRSIDVFQVNAQQREGRGECTRYASVRHGAYDATGQFHWRGSTVAALPPAFRGTERYGDICPDIWVRAVFVDWEDQEGTYGFEQVDY